jgi:hypothetical protein
MGILSPGDLITVIDRDEREALIRVQYVDDELSEVGIAIEREIVFEPSDGDFQIRHAGGRGRGTRWQIISPTGQIVSDNIAGKKTAERELEVFQTMVKDAA